MLHKDKIITINSPKV